MILILAKRIIASIRDFIYPSLCFTCEKHVEDSRERVCAECCSTFLPFQIGDAVWSELKIRFDQEGVVSDFLSCYYFEERGKLQDVIHLVKYRGVKTLGVMLGREIGKRMRDIERFLFADCLVPVPLHPLKRRERGYNQSEFLVQGIADTTGICANSHVLRRVKYTQSQTLLSLEERRANVADAFAVPRRYTSEIHGKVIILVDDVITTGSTLNASARALIQAGAKDVLAVSVAVAR